MPDRSFVVKMMSALMLVLGTACAGSKPPEAPATTLIDQMRKLTQAPQLTFELVRDTLEVAFTVDENSSHDMVTFYIGTTRAGSRYVSLIKLVDCRVPSAQNTALKDPFVMVELLDAASASSAAPLSAKDITAKLGQPYSFDPALPEDPETWGNTIYKYALRSLWVSFGRKDPDKVRSFSIHPLEDVR